MENETFVNDDEEEPVDEEEIIDYSKQSLVQRLASFSEHAFTLFAQTIEYCPHHVKSSFLQQKLQLEKQKDKLDQLVSLYLQYGEEMFHNMSPVRQVSSPPSQSPQIEVLPPKKLQIEAPIPSYTPERPIPIKQPVKPSSSTSKLLEQSPRNEIVIREEEEEDYGPLSVAQPLLSLQPTVTHGSGRKLATHPTISSNQPSTPNFENSSNNWSSNKFPWSRKIETNLKDIFGIVSFRPNQLEAINAIMGKRDVFVVLPTGFGKSLCYQLPAIISPGLTIVVSPLISLIQDQIMALQSLGIECNYFYSGQSQRDSNSILRDLHSPKPRIKLLYVTPEKINKSAKFKSALEQLARNNLVDRFVIDEAHCVSSWGHDFRKDYLELSQLKHHYSHIPIMALTATATSLVQEDILKQLNLKNCVIFKGSFNRSNLMYQVRRKGNFETSIQDLHELISTKFPNASGIIYCLSKNDCNRIEMELREKGISIAAYHGDLSHTQRQAVHHKWSTDKVRVIVATTAFGMGINKSDVRFIIHHSIPKSIEDYYQESGRAGRDGLESTCILYFSMTDKPRALALLHSSNKEQKKPASHCATKSKSPFETLGKVIHYAENQTVCRRRLLLQHFGEDFDPKDCNKKCDTCCDDSPIVEKDVIKEVKGLLSIIKSIPQNKFTMTHCIGIWRGSKISKIVNEGHDKLSGAGSGALLKKNEAEALANELLGQNFVHETLHANSYGGIYLYLSQSKKAWEILSEKLDTYVVKFRQQKKKKRKEQSSSSTVEEVQKMDAKDNLQALLEKKRRQIADNLDKGERHVMTNVQITALVKYQPKTLDELCDTERFGFGKARLKNCAIPVLQVIRDYCYSKGQSCTQLNEGEIADIKAKLGIKDDQENSTTKRKKEKKQAKLVLTKSTKVDEKEVVNGGDKETVNDVDKEKVVDIDLTVVDENSSSEDESDLKPATNCDDDDDTLLSNEYKFEDEDYKFEDEEYELENVNVSDNEEPNSEPPNKKSKTE